MMTPLVRSTPATLAVVTALVAVFVAAGVSLFKLSIGGSIALYFVVWWTLLFAVLPLRNEPETRPGHVVPGQDPGAPASPRLREKAIWTTLVAGVAFLAALAVFPLTGL
jgi:predicted secreted protein